jgi:hypothetical protein
VQNEIHVLGLDPGGTTGWCRLTIPRLSLFGKQPSEIVEWDYGEFAGDEIEQVFQICRLAREVQGLSYRLGPALVIEDWDSDPSFKTTDPQALSPVRIGAMLRFAIGLGHMQNGLAVRMLEDATLTFQGRTIAKSTATDDRLEAWGLYTAGSPHVRDATRHAVVALRRARSSAELRASMWPYAASYRD